ncbi:MAG: DUF5672 family protein [Siphonobacter sp.]
MNSLVSVIIPIYKQALTPYEEVSFQQCINILAAYPIIIVKPDSLNLEHLQRYHSAIRYQSFEDQYFKNIEGYNHLLTSPHFYEAFSNYQYILIYQLDAFVFRDDLKKWCEKGYDYIGAPNYIPAVSRQEDSFLKRMRLNGGLSLRKVSSCKRLLSLYRSVYGQWPGNEDMLFSLNSNRLIIFSWLMKLPKWKIALAFAIEQFPAACMELNQKRLPFGCHAWERYDIDFWRPYFKQYGHSI